MARNELLDLIFSLFRATPRWSIKTLREKTQQPEAYLKEVLSEVATQHRSGEFNSLWELKDTFKNESVRINLVVRRQYLTASNRSRERTLLGPARKKTSRWRTF
jgi:hypothetical protein